ncbi:glucosaminidase domain-containing protein [Phascolarctobacterium sp.]|uniref:glucosaminidase domain-containing protein n=1 Tax=Phascolarctobacterium sp. TaxID=2049039 RepID=UPI003867632D
MNYKKLTACCLTLACLAGCIQAEAASKVEKAQQKAAKKLLQEVRKRNGADNVSIRPGSKGGIVINTESKDAKQGDKGSASAIEKVDVKANTQNPPAVKTAQKSVRPKDVKPMLVEDKKTGKSFFLGTELPSDYKNISIFGDAVASKKQAVNLIKNNNPKVRLACSVEELVDLYWQEAGRENVRPDLALAQSLVETGSYSYGGDVQHHQNNFCGLGTTGGGVRGASFKTPELGARAHIQHLLAYTQKKRPSTKIVDPRYELAHNIRLERGVVDTWYGLNGTWAMGSYYCEKIMAMYQKMLAMEGAEKQEEVKGSSKDKQKAKKRKSMRQRIEEIMEEK